VVQEFSPVYGITGQDLAIFETAAWLHDAVEDTGLTHGEVEQTFGYGVGRLIWAVTNDPGKNRKERFENTYPKILLVGRDALFLKLADRIANVRASIQGPDAIDESLLKMYRKEYPEFQRALRRPGIMSEMWDELDRMFA
jgi:(p)ppGpp synthase/HD superfamily hydrolase